MSKPKSKLTNQEKIFKQEYLIDLNVERAAKVAGYSETMAKSKAYQWVSNSKIKPHLFNAIQKTLKKRADKLEITADTVIRDIVRIGNKAEGSDKYGDALKSRELLGKHLKLFTDKMELGFDDSAFKAILAILPPEYAEQVKRLLIEGKGK